MGGLLHLALGLTGIGLHRTGARVASVSMIFAAALLFLLIGLLGFAGVAFLLLAQATSPMVAALICGSSGLFIGALLLLLARARAQPMRLLMGRNAGKSLPAFDPASLARDASDTEVRGALVLTALAAFLLSTRR
ncbi:MAG: hypothetical protein J0L76_09615 [Rhodobacterales bacterium]|nr:hypothetical protein [Rhodobacterales bacterium]